MQKVERVSNVEVMSDRNKLLLFTICFKENQEGNYQDREFKPTLINKGTNEQGNHWFRYELPNKKYFFMYINQNGKF